MEIAAEMRMILIDRGANRVQRVAQETGAGGESFACFTETCILVDAFAGNAVVQRCAAQMKQRAIRMAAEQAVADGENPRVGACLQPISAMG